MPKYKRARTLTELEQNFREYTGKRVTKFQKWALEEEAQKMGIC
jgi:ribosomal protein S12